MKNRSEDNLHKEEMFLNEFILKEVAVQKAPDGFTNRFMQAIHPVQELNPAIKKPLLDIKGKLTALVVFALLFLAGISIGHEVTEYAGITRYNDMVKSIINMDYTIMVTTLLFSFTILLLFNEFLKKHFVRR